MDLFSLSSSHPSCLNRSSGEVRTYRLASGSAHFVQNIFASIFVLCLRHSSPGKAASPALAIAGHPGKYYCILCVCEALYYVSGGTQLSSVSLLENRTTIGRGLSPLLALWVGLLGGWNTCMYVCMYIFFVRNTMEDNWVVKSICVPFCSITFFVFSRVCLGTNSLMTSSYIHLNTYLHIRGCRIGHPKQRFFQIISYTLDVSTSVVKVFIFPSRCHVTKISVDERW